MGDVSGAKAEIDRLWGSQSDSRTGPKAKLTGRQVARRAIALADQNGIHALTMRSVAQALGVSPMALYTYFPSKNELIEVMVDETFTEPSLTSEMAGGWKERLIVVAERNWSLLMHHPWLADVEGFRPVLGPNVIAKYDFELSALEGVGLSDVEMDLVLATVLNFVRGAAKTKLDAAAAVHRTGQADDVWWRERGPLLAKVLGDRYPLAQRVGAAAGAHYDAPADPDLGFRFGLERLIDGIGLMLPRQSLRV
ncbi:TetR/AcrR family transcriptional regulator [Devosia sp. ZW T5_3]|uniref:TetR/AcrR family transcriptional regulator n=1 Tax=Devosia sp. ZW T5_3 TaxID=3378085 RepID=UPI003851E59F